MKDNLSQELGARPKSGREIAGDNLLRFESWVAERDNAGDWQDYVHRGKLNRTEIALECEFALAVLRQNPAVKAALTALETRLRADGELTASTSLNEKPNADAVIADESGAAVTRRLSLQKNAAEKRIKALEEHNAALLAEVSHLREKLREYKLIDEYLAATGRMVRP